MSAFDPLDVDGRLLALLVAVVEERSITRAAERLGVTQSAVSHGLERLRAWTGAPVVVRSGRGVVPTARAQALAVKARGVLEGLTTLVDDGPFDAARFAGRVQIAANPLQRDLLLPGLLARLREQAPHLTLRVVPSDVPSAEMLRDAACHLVISPRLPEAGDIVHKRLFEDRYAVYFDAAVRTAPRSRAEWESAEHVCVMHAPQRPLAIDGWLDAHGFARDVVVQVADFSGARAFIAGTARVATLPSLLRAGALAGLAQAPLPFDCDTMPMYALWHVRHQDDPMHRWLRAALEAVVSGAAVAD
ncbi:MAG TPA: LysR family transcriptional regulator [Burkholderiaceae bacterium]|nr:LysR family transcriptional regulator [Burkholderiaceae bacterium]